MGIRTLAASLLLVICACDASPVSSPTAPVVTTSPSTSIPATTVPPTAALDPTTTVPTDSVAIDPGPLTARGGHSVIWTGEEMIVWGGESSDGGARLADGAAFDPVAGTWRVIADAPVSPRVYHVATWTGEEMLVVGGRGEVDGAAYEPTTDSWRDIEASPIPLDSTSVYDSAVGSAWTGQELVVWSISTNQIAAYAPETDIWRILPSVDLVGDSGALRWTGADLFAFADQAYSQPLEGAPLESARLNQEGGWEAMSPAEFSTDDSIIAADARLVGWTGENFIAWTAAGFEGKTLTLFPFDGNWTETDAVPFPPCDFQGEPIQAGDQVIAFGTCGSLVAFLDPDTDAWTTTAVVEYATARYTVWTGTELLNWGGGYYTLDAWLYAPAD